MNKKIISTVVDVIGRLTPADQRRLTNMDRDEILLLLARFGVETEEEDFDQQKVLCASVLAPACLGQGTELPLPYAITQILDRLEGHSRDLRLTMFLRGLRGVDFEGARVLARQLRSRKICIRPEHLASAMGSGVEFSELFQGAFS